MYPLEQWRSDAKRGHFVDQCAVVDAVECFGEVEENGIDLVTGVQLHGPSISRLEQVSEA